MLGLLDTLYPLLMWEKGENQLMITWILNLNKHYAKLTCTPLLPATVGLAARAPGFG